MPELPPLSPFPVALALSGTVFITAWLSAGVIRWYRYRRRRHLPALPGASALALAGTLAGQRRAALSALACALCSGATALFATPAPRFDTWQSVDSLAAGGLCALIALCSTIAVRRWPREQRAADEVLARHRIAARLDHISMPSQRVFHDVLPGAGGSIAHVLTSASGIYAVFTLADRFDAREAVLADRNTLLLPRARAAVDLRAIRSRTAQLQHWLEANSGVVCRVRSVVVLSGWQASNDAPPDMLFVMPKDVVMLQGWRDSSQALMDDELGRIQAALETAGSPSFDSWARYRANALARRQSRQATSIGVATAAKA